MTTATKPYFRYEIQWMDGEGGWHKKHLHRNKRTALEEIAFMVKVLKSSITYRVFDVVDQKEITR